MSVEHKAMLVKGYELTEGWELIVDADYVMAHEDYFIEADAYEGEKIIFGNILDAVESGGYTEYSTYMGLDEEKVLSDFIKQYPGAVINTYPAMYLVCKIH